MGNNLLFIFKTEDIKRLAENESDYIVIRSFLQSVFLKAGALRLYADAVNKGDQEAIESVDGCPCPPCNPNDDPDEMS